MILAATDANIAHAAQRLSAGDIVGIPTETVYGLAADALNAQAVAKIYATKGRPSNHPLIVHLAPLADVGVWAHHVPDYAKTLMHAFWPGPLTLVLPRTHKVGDFITGGQNTVAMRCPSHPVAQALLNACSTLGIAGLAAPSANVFGRVSPTDAAHVEFEFNSTIPVLDGGECMVGIESTIVDCTQATPRVLRHGDISLADIAQATGLPVVDAVGLSTAPKVSGSLTAHYAPNTPMQWCEPAFSASLPEGTIFMGFDQLAKTQHPMARFHAMPRNAKQYARQLYATLRQLDTQAHTLIAVQPLPTDPEWAGVQDRLNRAVATFKTANH